MHGFFFQCGSLGHEQYGYYLIQIDLQKLELFGTEYISQFISMKMTERENEMAYQIYISEAMRLHAEGKGLSARFADIILPKKNVRTKTAEEAKQGILAEFDKINRGEIDGGKH